MADVAVFDICPPIRCSSPVRDPYRLVCGEVATWRAEPVAGAPAVYRCAKHRQPADRPLEGPVIFRRVTVAAVVWFAGVGESDQVCQAEALARLERAVADAGGLMRLNSITCVSGRYEPLAPPARGRPGRGRAL